MELPAGLAHLSYQNVLYSSGPHLVPSYITCRMPAYLLAWRYPHACSPFRLTDHLHAYLPAWPPIHLATCSPICLACLHITAATYLPTCLPSRLPTYPSPTYLLSYRPTCPPAFLCTHLLAHLPTYLPARLSTYLPVCLPTDLRAYLPAYLPALLPSYLPT